VSKTDHLALTEAEPGVFYVEGYAEPVFGIQMPGGRFLRTHKPDKCKGPTCVIHNPSDHHMREWPLNWRGDRGLMERICEHGVGHPDPDDIAFKVSLGLNSEDVHGCDGCCASPNKE
jgi:hypothetical protein